jgi:hypothetical protein
MGNKLLVYVSCMSSQLEESFTLVPLLRYISTTPGEIHNASSIGAISKFELILLMPTLWILLVCIAYRCF